MKLFQLSLCPPTRRTVLGLAFSGIAACASAQSGTNAVTVWNDACLQAIADTKMGAPIGARAIGMLQTSVYDAWAAYHECAVGVAWKRNLRQPARERTDANKQTAICYAAYDTLVDLFPTEKPLFDSILASFNLPNSTTTVANTPTGVGNLAAAWELSARHNDGANQLGNLHPGAYSDYTGYKPVNTATQINDPTQWQPITFLPGTPQAKTPAYLAPHWGLVKPFSLPSGSALRPGPPPTFGSETMVREVDELINYTAHLTDFTKAVAETWAGGPGTVTPPGFWCQIARNVSVRDSYDLNRDVEMYFLVGNALMDAGITCWECKRAYDSSRPWTAIHYLYKDKVIPGWGGSGKGSVSLLGQDWRPYQPLSFITPPFPEHVSGHSTFSAAAAEVLKLYTGSDYYGGSLVVRAGSIAYDSGAPSEDVTLSYPTFTAAADQAGISRLYGGIHYRAANLNGQTLGREVGDAVALKALAYFCGWRSPFRP